MLPERAHINQHPHPGLHLYHRWECA